MKVYHYTDKANLDSIMHSGLKTTSRYESFTELRKDVVFCWLSPSDNKLFSNDTICLEITVRTMQQIGSWEESERVQGCIAVQAGAIRLIDNIKLK